MVVVVEGEINEKQLLQVQEDYGQYAKKVVRETMAEVIKRVFSKWLQ